MTTIVNTSLQNFVSMLKTTPTVSALNLRCDGPVTIQSELVLAVLSQMNEIDFLEAAKEVAESEELGNGYDLFKDGSYNFYENNKALLLGMVETLADERNRKSVLDFIYNCIDTDIFSVEKKHSDAIINSSAETNSKILEGDCMMIAEQLPPDHSVKDCNESCMRDAYETVAYQLGAHSIMKACEAFNSYKEGLALKAA